MEYDQWKKHLMEQVDFIRSTSKNSNFDGASGMMNTVKVRRVAPGASGLNSARDTTGKGIETKAKPEDDQLESEPDSANNECLLNYTFDMSLDDHMRAGPAAGQAT